MLRSGDALGGRRSLGLPPRLARWAGSRRSG
jgi:hypothetical protein